MMNTIQWTGDNLRAVEEFRNGKPLEPLRGVEDQERWGAYEDIVKRFGLKVGDEFANPGDWLVKDVDGTVRLERQQGATPPPSASIPISELRAMLERTEAMDAGAVENEYAEGQWWVLEMEAFWGDSAHPVTLNTRRAAKVALDAWRAALTPSPSVPAPGSDKVEALAKRLETSPHFTDGVAAASDLRTLSAERDEQARLKWEAYDANKALIADRDRLTAERDAIAQDLRSALHREIEGRKDRDRLTADLGEAVKALEGAKADLLELAGSEEHLAPAVERIDVVLASLRARSEASHGG